MKIKRQIKALLLSILLISSLFAVGDVFAQPDIRGVLGEAGREGFGQDVESASGRIGPLIASIVQIILGFVGTIAFILFLMGGVLWLTARGNDDQVAKAKKYMINATIGIIVIILAYSVTFYISSVVFQATTGR